MLLLKQQLIVTSTNKIRMNTNLYLSKSLIHFRKRNKLNKEDLKNSKQREKFNIQPGIMIEIRGGYVFNKLLYTGFSSIISEGKAKSITPLLLRYPRGKRR